MELKTSGQKLDYLFTAKPIDVQTRAAFEARVGWRYGLVFGIALLLVAWGVDTAELAYAHAAFFWIKFLIAAVLVIPLSLAAGAVAGQAHGSIGRKILVWTIVGALIGFIAIHIPFEGASLVAALLDPAARGLMLFPFTSGVQERVVALILFGAVAGLLAGVLQIVGTMWAWERSTVDNRLTPGGWIALLISLPLAILLGSLFDGAANSQLRGPQDTTHRVIELALNTPADANLQAMETLTVLDYVAARRWRDQFTPQYTQGLADYDPVKLMTTYLDTEFSDGFLWRCEVTRNGAIMQACMDLTETYRDYMAQFLGKGTVQCENCDIRIAKAASDWRSSQASGLVPTQTTVVHHAGGLVLVTAQLSKGGQVECRFLGASPVIIYDCASR